MGLVTNFKGLLSQTPFNNTRIFAEMVKKVSVTKQIILATQSIELLDNFDVDDIVVVDNNANGSKFKRLERESLTCRLENEYSLGELWNKNVLGGV